MHAIQVFNISDTCREISGSGFIIKLTPDPSGCGREHSRPHDFTFHEANEDGVSSLRKMRRTLLEIACTVEGSTQCRVPTR